MDIFLFSLAVLPVVLLAIIIYRQDRFEREPFGKLVGVFFLGVLATVPAIMMELLLEKFRPAGAIEGGLYGGFVVAGCCEEAAKLLLLYWAVWRSREFNEYFDGIVYACFVSLGFACCENILYVCFQGTWEASLLTGSVRAVLSVPAHFLFGVMMGYYFALAKFDVAHRRRNLLLAFLMPMLLHGTFDALLMIPEGMEEKQELLAGALFVAFVVFDVMMWRWGIRRIRALQLRSQQAGPMAFAEGDTTYTYGEGEEIPFPPVVQECIYQHKSKLAKAILCTVFFGVWFGAPGIVYAALANAANSRGEYEQAQHYNRVAARWINVNLIVGIVLLVLLVMADL